MRKLDRDAADLKRRLTRRVKQRKHARSSLPQLRVKRKWATVSHEVWLKCVSQNGVLQWNFSVNGWDVFVLRIRRGNRLRYYFTVIDFEDVFRLSYDCKRGEHEAMTFNNSLTMLGVRWKAG